MFDYGSIWACTFFYLFYVNQKAFLRINVGSTVALNACNSCNDIFSGKLPTPPPPPPPQANINTDVSLRAKWSLRGGVGGQFPRNLTWSVLYFPVVMVCSRVALASFWLIQIVVAVNRGNLYVDIKLQNWLFKWMLIHGHSPRSVQIYNVGHDLVCRKDAWWGFQTAQACSNFYYGRTIIRTKSFFIGHLSNVRI